MWLLGFVENGTRKVMRSVQQCHNSESQMKSAPPSILLITSYLYAYYHLFARILLCRLTQDKLTLSHFFFPPPKGNT